MALKEKKLPGEGDDSAGAEFIRRFRANPFLVTGTIVILVIVIVAFVLVPALVPNTGGPEGDVNFGYYNKRPISYVRGNYFAQMQSLLAQNRQSQINEGNYQLEAYDIWRGAFEAAVVRMGILDEMKKAGYTPPQREVDREVALLPQFQENGRFSAVKYRQLDRVERLSLWREVQDDIAARLYVSDMTGLSISSREAAFVASMAGPRRSFYLALFPLASYPDSEVAAYGREKPALFEVVHLSSITVSSEKEAGQLLRSIGEGAAGFEETARGNSKDSYAEKSGDMGIKMAHELATDIPGAEERAAVIGLARGALSPVVKTPRGWSFFRAEEAPRAADLSDPAVLEKIRSYLMSFERGRIEDWVLGEANSFIAGIGERDFQTACAEGGIVFRNFGPLAVNYGDAPFFASLSSFGVTELESAGTNENFWRTAFTAPLGSPAAPLILGDNGAVIFPREEIPVDETVMENIKNYYPFYMGSSAEQGIRSHFLTSPKLEDKFMATFIRYFWPSN
jgi:parvulin-like peptidyl-prolyl isomerase